MNIFFNKKHPLILVLIIVLFSLLSCNPCTNSESPEVAFSDGNFENAIKYFQMSIEIYNELNNPIKVAMAIEWIGSAFERQGHFREALEKYQEALRLKKQYWHATEVERTENNIARVKAKLGR